MNLRVLIASQMLKLGAFFQCLLVAVLRPSDMSEWARARYDRQSGEWNLHNNPDQGLSEDEQVLWERVPARAGRILILGGGGGREAIFFARQGLQVTAFDLSDGMLAQARAMMQARGLAIETTRGDLAAFDAPAHSCDAVWTSMFLYSVVLGRARRLAILERIRRTLAPGGWLVVSFHLDPDARLGARGDRLRRLIARLTCGNAGYQNGDALFGTLEFRHCFESEAEARAEFAASGFDVAFSTAFAGLMRGGAVLVKKSEWPGVSTPSRSAC